MFIIAHRGNIDGPSSLENHPLQIERALNKGFHAETDVWYVDKELWLGHDKPQYKVEVDFLKNEKLWCHAKNIEALDYLLRNEIHCFWHEEDSYTLTSQGWIWAYPEKLGTKKTITVMPEISEKKYKVKGGYGGVCTDYPKLYSK